MKLFNVWFLCVSNTGRDYEETGLVVAKNERNARRRFAQSLGEFKRNHIKSSNVTIAEDVILLA